MKSFLNKRNLSILIIILCLLSFFTLLKRHDSIPREEIISYTPASIQKEIDSFTSWTDHLVAEIISSSPLSATFMYSDLESLGLGTLSSELDDFSPEFFNSQFLHAQSILSKLDDIDYTLLTNEQKATYEVLKFQNQLVLAGKSFLYYDHIVEPSSGIQMNLPLSLIQLEFSTPNQVDDYLNRLNEIPRLFKQLIAYEEVKLEKGLLMPKELYKLVIEQIDNLLCNPKEFMIYLSFVEKLEAVEGLSHEEKETYKNKCLWLITEKIYPAYRDLKTSSTRSMEVASSNQGIYSYEKGYEYYNYIIKNKTSYDLTGEELLAWISNELYTTISTIQELYRDYPELLEYEDFSQALPTYNTIEELYAIEERCLSDFFYDYGINRASENIIPPYLEKYVAAGFYFPISIDGSSYGNMYLQEDFYTNINANTLELYFHENIPGHHLYFSKFYSSKLPMIRKISTWLPYEEGWAQYIQNLSIDYYGLSEPLTTLFKATSKLSSYYMLLVDIKFHYEGISVDEALQIFLDLGYPKSAAQKAINRMIAHPGEIIHYVYGGYKIEGYFELCKKELGDKFDIKDFHHMILEHAELPFYYMDGIVDLYIKEKFKN